MCGNGVLGSSQKAARKCSKKVLCNVRIHRDSSPYATLPSRYATSGEYRFRCMREGLEVMRKIAVVLASAALAVGVLFFGTYLGPATSMRKARAQLP